MTLSQQNALLRVREGKSIMREYARNLKREGYIDIVSGKDSLTDKGRHHCERVDAHLKRKEAQKPRLHKMRQELNGE